MNKVFLLGALAALSSCSSEQQAQADKMKLKVAAKLKDPDSARFTSLRMTSSALCGEVNGKNSFGAYSGADQFWATDSHVELRSEAIGRDEFLDGTRASDEWKKSTDRFDDFWDKCQKDGKEVS